MVTHPAPERCLRGVQVLTPRNISRTLATPVFFWILNKVLALRTWLTGALAQDLSCPPAWLCEKHPCWFGELPKSQSPDNSSRFMVFAFLGMSQNTLLCWAAPVIFQQLSLFPSHYVFLLKFPFKEWFMQQGKGMTWLPPQFPSLCRSCAVPSELELSFQTPLFPCLELSLLFLAPLVCTGSRELFAA